MTQRTYVETAGFHAPFNPIPFQGLGDDELPQPRKWPGGRRYFDVSNFRAPYDEGYYQDGSLRGTAPALIKTVPLVDRVPPKVRRYLTSGVPVSSWQRDLAVPFNQIHPLIYGALGALALGLSYLSYKKFKKRGSSQTG